MYLASLTLAEPPVDDGYPTARSPHDDNYGHQTSEHQRSLSQEYGPPSLTSNLNAPSSKYMYDKQNSPNVRGQSRFAPATVRVSFNQRFSTSGSKSSARDITSDSRRLSQKYAAPKSGVSQEYGLPMARSLLQEYGAPSQSAMTLSAEYGVPNARSSPSEEYAAPVLAARSNQKLHSPATNFYSTQPARALSYDYSKPAPRSQFQTGPQSQGYSSSSASYSDSIQDDNELESVFHSRSNPSTAYVTLPTQSLSSSYSTPSTRSSDTQNYDSTSQTYGAPSQRDLSDTYGVPRAWVLSQEHGVSSRGTNLKTDAIAYSSTRSAPSSTYLPSARDAMPSQQYGVPEQNNQGYDNARARALNELLNQAPANYDFSYQIEDDESGSDFGHTETRQDNRAEGSYFVVLPDGTKQTVEYEADERGYKPRISVEPAIGGYDRNAVEIARSKGPY